MKLYKSFIKAILLFGILILLLACMKMSEHESDYSVGINGGFEVVKNGLPVNWLMYTPNTVPDADFTIELDETLYKEGEKSLKFDVKKCSSIGGWKSPGFTNEFGENGGFVGEGNYKISFWVKNDGAKFRIEGGGVSPKKGEMQILIADEQQYDSWQFFEYEIYVPKERHLRLQLNILQPGTFWIDDIRIERMKT